MKLADALGWGVVVLHDAKGMFPETHPCFLGVYSPFYTSPTSVKECYEAADALLCIGVHWNEMSTGAPPDQVRGPALHGGALQGIYIRARHCSCHLSSLQARACAQGCASPAEGNVLAAHLLIAQAW